MQSKPFESVQAAAESLPYDRSTEEFARLNQVKGASVVARICRTGSYFGVVPQKLANGRLAFPGIQVKRGGNHGA